MIAGIRIIILRLLLLFDIPVIIRHPVTQSKFQLLSYSHRAYWFRREQYDRFLLVDFPKMFNDHDVVFDIGAHIGYFAVVCEDILTATPGARGRYVCFEPSPANRKFLLANLVNKNNVFGCVIADHIGAVRLYTDNLGGFLNSTDLNHIMRRGVFRNQPRQIEIREYLVDATTLDNFSAFYNISPTILKIDVEGSELAVLKGGLKALATVRLIYVEVTNKIPEVFEILESSGFFILKITSAGLLLEYPRHQPGNYFCYRRSLGDAH